MKKIPNEIDNPIDNVLIQFADCLCPYFYRMGYTPNMITTYSLLTGMISCYFLYHKKLALFALFYFVSYFFDCFDGHYARKYDMTSTIGDMYDHFKDWTVFLIILYISYINSKHNMNIRVFSLILIIILMMCIHMSCQEANCDNKFKNVNNNFILHSSLLCSDKDNIKWTKYFGCGTFTVLYIAIVCWINRD
jgi:phosphatidylglycerophosphate synthase